MSNALIASASLLADTLAEENAALRALDLPRAAAMLPDKQRAAAGFMAAQAETIEAAQTEAAKSLVLRLQSLAQDNRLLLERAIAVQGRVIEVAARAAIPSVAPAGYSAHGKPCQAHRPTAFALSARA
jgi:flagellar biosynthesis/type III secretory pathway chaperone